MKKTVYVVEVSYEDEDPGVFGPYTQAQAERVAAKISEEVELSKDEWGGNFHMHSVRGANAYPLTRYEQFMTGPQRLAARGQVTLSNKETERRIAEEDY